MEFTVWWEVGLGIRLPKGTMNNSITTVVSAIQDKWRVPGRAGAGRTDLSWLGGEGGGDS